ncbi:MAG: protoporphyrinogen oxidase [Actinomycetes bacterium]
MTAVVVVGGGVSGLGAARVLARAGLAVTVLEAGPGWGGKVQALDLEGVRLDAGAESVLARRPEAVRLIADLGLPAVHPTAARPEVLISGRPHPLPPSVLGVPTDLAALEGLLTADGLARARREPERPASPLPGDLAIGRLVDARFGPEVTDRLVEPLLGGVYAGRARELSFAATAPSLYAAARAGGSLLAAARTVARPDAGAPVFAGLVGGVHRLVDALVADLTAAGVGLRSRVTATELHPRARGYLLRTEGPEGRGSCQVDGVVLATSARATGRLLAPLLPAAADWAGWPYASTAVVTLVVAGLAPTASGLLVPPGELPTIKALTYSSAKWDWVRAVAEDRWGPGVAVVRASVGRIGEEPLLQVDDQTLRDRTFREAQGLPGWRSARLITGRVARWGGGLPQYEVGHLDRVARLRRALASSPGLAVCGAALDGVGIAACLGSAKLAGTKIQHDLGAMGAGNEESG